MKKKIFVFLIAVFMLFPGEMLFAADGFDAFITDSGVNEITLDFEIGNFTLENVEKNGVAYSSIDFPVKVTTMEKGFAKLPFVHASVVLPDDGEVSVEVVSEKYRDIKLDHPLLPSRGVIYRNEKPENIPFITDAKSIVNKWYPEEPVKISEPYIIRTVRGANVYVFPFRYNALKRTLRVYTSISVKVKTDTSVSLNPLTENLSSLPASMNSLFKDMFLNYQPRRSLSEYGEILVIYTPRDASVIQPYVEWKRKKGFKVYTSQVAAGTNVKNIISQFYSNHPSLLYVQLVGDWADIKSDKGTSANAPMDPVLGCVAGNDNVPDLIIGRFSASSSADVTTQVNKAVNYEKNAEMNGSWYPKGLGIGSGEGSGNGDDGEADYKHIDIIKDNKLLPFTYSTVHEVYQSGSASSVAGYVNSGLSLINYCGHGSSTSWATSGFSNSDINSLSNGSKLPVIISVACVNGQFHNGSDCFAEAWLKKTNGGAVAALMATINQPWQPPMRGQDYMNDLLTGGYNYSSNPGSGTNVTEGRTTFGSIVFNGLVLMYAESSGSSDLDTIQTWTIFGDSSLQVRTKAPVAIALSNTSVTPGSAFTTKVTKTSSGAGVHGARVCLQQNDVVFTGVTDSSGDVTINHNFTAGVVSLSASGFNLETKTTNINLGGSVNQPPTSSFTYSKNELEVSFTDTSTDNDGSIVSRQWTFGDGSSSTEANPVHTYSADGTYTVSLKVTDNDGAENTSSQQVSVAQYQGPAVTELSNGESISGLSDQRGNWKYYRINIPSGASNFKVEIKNGSGDADVYTRYSEVPTKTEYYCRPYKWGNNETCTNSSPTPGNWYIGIHAYSDYSGVTLKVSHN